MLNEHGSYGVVVMDLHAARFYSFLLGELTQLAEKRFGIDESQWKRKDVGHVGSERTRKAHGSDRDLFEHRLKAQYERLFRETADQTIALSKQHAFTGIFLVGHERLLSPTLDKFPPAIRERLVLVPEDFGNFSTRGILRRLEPRITDYERKRQVAHVEQLLSADSGSITDVDETLARLQKGTVRTILVAADQDFHLRECEQCGTATRSSDLVCADCGGKRRSIALLDLLPRLAAAQGTKIEFVRGKAAQNLVRAGGLAGWLRQTKSTTAG
jgi:peptide subunit release factor 1 (eRF1)